MDRESAIMLLADHIHEHRLLGPPTCDGCIGIARRSAAGQEGVQLRCNYFNGPDYSHGARGLLRLTSVDCTVYWKRLLLIDGET